MARPLSAVFRASIICATIVVLACGGGGDGSPPEPTAEATQAASGSGPAEQALARYVETTLGKPFKEDCATANAQEDTGKICSTYRGERNGQRAYVLGATFSEGTQWAILGQSGGTWNVVSTSQLTPDTAAVPGVPWPIVPNSDVVVAGTGDCLNVREGPALNQKAVDCIKDGTTIRIAAGPTAGDNIQWWQVQGRSGWVAADFLRYPDALQ